MNSKAWLLLNLALLGTTGVTVTNVAGLPGDIRKEQADIRKTIDKATENSQEGSKSTTRTAKTPGRKSARNAEAGVSDTWPDIRPGSLDALWKKSLFNKNRTEVLISESTPELSENSDELPAPPNFELIGILTLGSSKVAIIELKNTNSSRTNPMNRMGRPRPPMPGQPPQPLPATQSESEPFQPTFLTAHENDELRDTGYTLVTIKKEENCVILEKSGLQYKLSLEANNSSAQQRVANQATYVESQKQKAEAAARQQQQQQQQRNQQANQQGNRPPMPPGMQGGPGGWNRNGQQGGPGGWNRNGQQGGPGGFSRGYIQGGGGGGWYNNNNNNNNGNSGSSNNSSSSNNSGGSSGSNNSSSGSGSSNNNSSYSNNSNNNNNSSGNNNSSVNNNSSSGNNNSGTNTAGNNTQGNSSSQGSTSMWGPTRVKTRGGYGPAGPGGWNRGARAYNTYRTSNGPQ